MSTPEPGLRELKKQMTHESIANAALKLTLDKGLNNVTIDDIAHEAFVSPRTVSNYFASKEEAVLAAGTPDWFAVVEEFAEGPPTERPLATLCELMSNFIRSRTREQLRLIVQTIELVDQHPTLHSLQTAAYDNLEEALRQGVADRTGTDPNAHMYPWLVAAAAVSAIRSALRLWAQSAATADRLPELVQDAFNQISDGLPARLSAVQTH
ncbi:TetR/AcrR family transcriptional regulator [Citricoccus sp. GCM10030269]|uniref:TetR/AcrR family transcriptional regulator n=1 Tax=Citricoccus sp. GCM10030269 TaxID=3273388 RepID=UPI0036244DD6